jgi:hypothetical protein
LAEEAPWLHGRQTLEAAKSRLSKVNVDRGWRR